MTAAARFPARKLPANSQLFRNSPTNPVLAPLLAAGQHLS
jgi:hypothetical protein